MTADDLAIVRQEIADFVGHPLDADAINKMSDDQVRAAIPRAEAMLAALRPR